MPTPDILILRSESRNQPTKAAKANRPAKKRGSCFVTRLFQLSLKMRGSHQVMNRRFPKNMQNLLTNGK